MASERQEQIKAPDVISEGAQRDLLARCEAVDMQPDQLSLSQRVLENPTMPQSQEDGETWEIIDGQTEEGRRRLEEVVEKLWG